MNAEIVASLSEDQREIYDRLMAGQTVEQIAASSGRPVGIIQAQRTRILNRGLSLPGMSATTATTGDSFVNESPTYSSPSPGPFANSGSRQNVEPTTVDQRSVEKIIDDASMGGSAEYNVEEIVARMQASGGGQQRPDTHPMVLLGVTIQFMKLAGGRMASHQLIEDVYGIEFDG